MLQLAWGPFEAPDRGMQDPHLHGLRERRGMDVGAGSPQEPRMGINKGTAIAAKGRAGEKREPEQQITVGVVSSEPEYSETSLLCASPS